MECDIETKQVKVFSVEGDAGPAGPAGSQGIPGPVGPIGPGGSAIPIYQNIEDFPVDRTVLLAWFNPLYGIKISESDTCEGILFQFCGGNITRENLVVFNASGGMIRTALPVGWKKLYDTI